MDVIPKSRERVQADALADRVVETITRTGPINGSTLLAELADESPAGVIRAATDLVVDGRLLITPERSFVVGARR